MNPIKLVTDYSGKLGFDKCLQNSVQRDSKKNHLAQVTSFVF